MLLLVFVVVVCLFVLFLGYFRGVVVDVSCCCCLLLSFVGLLY